MINQLIKPFPGELNNQFPSNTSGIILLQAFTNDTSTSTAIHLTSPYIKSFI